MPIILTKKEVKKLLQKPERYLKLNEIVFMLDQRVRELEKKVVILESIIKQGDQQCENL